MDEELICEMCGDDLATEGYRLCLDCLESLDDNAADWVREPA